MKNNNVFGIDLGTTNSCVAIVQNGNPTTISNDEGYPTTPSMVAFTANNQIYVGNPAKNQAFKNAENTIFDGKRFIGRRFSDREVQSDRKHWPFKVIDQSGRPCVQVTLGKKTIILTPEEISSMVLRKMKEIANDYTNQSNESMTRAVVTVPAYFKDSQRKATLDACTLAGIEVIRMINEPTAAAIAYGFNNKAVEGKNIIVLDIGGGTFDVSILSIDHHTFVVRATSGDSHLGGRDFDNRMMAHFIKHIKRTYHKDISTNPKKLARLRTACEQAKIFLSSNTTATINIESFLDGEDYSDTITQARFEKLNYDLFNKLFDPIDDAIQKSGLSKSEIDGVILVGGSSRIKLIQSKIESYFKGIPVYKNINPDVAVAHGAAILAYSLSSKSTSNSSHTSNTSNTSNNSNNTSNPSNNTSNNTSTNTSSTIQDLRVVDVIPLSLGLETVGGVMTSFIRGNTSIPAKKTKLFTTNVDNQSSVNVKIYEGERPFTRDNYLLDNFILNDIPPAPSGKPRIEVTFDIDINGILNVTAVELSTGQAKSITVVNNQERLSQDEIKRMIEEAKEFKKRDEEEMERLNYKNNLDLYLNQVLKTLRDNENSNNINTTQRETIVSTVNATREWMDDHPETTKEELINKRNELEQMITPILINL